MTISIAGCTAEGLAILPAFDVGDDAADDLGTEDGDTEPGDETNDGTNDGTGDPDGGSGSLDLPNGGQDPSPQVCAVADETIDAPLPCDLEPTTTTVDPVVAWTWTGPAGEDSVLVTPLVGNLDDDNQDGGVDLCDQPDLVVIAVDLPANLDNPNGKHDPIPAGHIYLLDSETGETKLVFDHPVDATATPALADLDGDGSPEILAFERSDEVLGQVGERRVIAFEADGSVHWISDTWVWSEGGGGLAIADLDGDGSPEILAPEYVLSADGVKLWAPRDPPLADSIPIAVDLDLDGTLEVLFGRSIYAADSTLLFELELPGNSNNIGVAAIANFDDDEFPEIYIQTNRHFVIEHDGQIKADCGASGGANKGLPVSILDVDGDGQAELLANHGTWFRATTIVDDHCETLWSIKIDHDSSSAATSFDFLADGTAETVYADLEWVRFYDEGKAIAQIQRQARPSSANPVIADADNDGAAELIIVGSEPIGGDGELSDRASVIYVQNADDQFAPTRRIWNQHAYHATNIREDATVPAQQQPHWQSAANNSFRNNVTPAYDGPLCQPPPSG